MAKEKLREREDVASKDGITEELRRRIVVNRCAAIERKNAKGKSTQEPEGQDGEAGAYKWLACEGEMEELVLLR